MRKYRWIASAVALLAMVAVAGCGGSGLESVSGTVTMAGKPLTNGSVSFHRVGGGALGTAAIRSDGSFTAQTGSQTGLAPGDYQITVVAYGPMPESTPENLEPIPPLITPAKYRNPKTSGLTCTVPCGQLELVLEP